MPGRRPALVRPCRIWSLDLWLLEGEVYTDVRHLYELGLIGSISVALRPYPFRVNGLTA